MQHYFMWHYMYKCIWISWFCKPKHILQICVHKNMNALLLDQVHGKEIRLSWTNWRETWFITWTLANYYLCWKLKVSLAMMKKRIWNTSIKLHGIRTSLSSHLFQKRYMYVHNCIHVWTLQVTINISTIFAVCFQGCRCSQIISGVPARGDGAQRPCHHCSITAEGMLWRYYNTCFTFMAGIHLLLCMHGLFLCVHVHVQPNKHCYQPVPHILIKFILNCSSCTIQIHLWFHSNSGKCALKNTCISIGWHTNQWMEQNNSYTTPMYMYKKERGKGGRGGKPHLVKVASTELVHNRITWTCSLQ